MKVPIVLKNDSAHYVHMYNLKDYALNKMEVLKINSEMGIDLEMVWGCREKMYLVACLRKLIFAFVEKLFRKRVGNLKNLDIKFPTNIDISKFNEKQLEVIKKGLQIGLNVSVYSKPKYTAEKMVLLYYALALKLDTENIANSALSTLEMEYQLYLETINSYLGKDYLKSLLQGNKSVGDMLVKKKINEDLIFEMSKQYNIESSKLLVEVGLSESEEVSERIIYANTLRQLCKDRGIDPNTIVLDSIPRMNNSYMLKEKEIVDKMFKYTVKYEKDSSLTIVPAREEILSKKELKDRLDPCKLYVDENYVCDYYIVESRGKIYLYNEDCILLEL